MGEITNQTRPSGTEENYHRTKMQEEMSFQKLREKGCRITKQRKILLNIILQEECASCKEIYYKARKEDIRIGAATVYRMINLLEEIGAISRKNMYMIPAPVREKNKEGSDEDRISVCMRPGEEIVCIIELDDHTACCLSAREWYLVMTEGLRVCGYIKQQKAVNILISPGLEPEEQEKSGAAYSVIERISQQRKTDGK